MSRHALVCGLFISILAARVALSEPPARATPAKAGVDSYGDPLPTGAKARIGSVRYRADEKLAAITFTADGKQIVTAAANYGPVRFWDPETGKQLRAWDKALESSVAFVFSADAKLAVSLGYRFDKLALQSKYTLRGWDVETGKITWEVTKEEDELGRHVALSDDGSRAATVANGDRLVIWDTLAGIPLVEHKTPKMRENSRLSPEGSFLVFSGVEGVQHWDWSAEDSPRLLIAHRKDRRLDRIVFSPDGKTVAACDSSRREGEIELFEAKSGKRIRSFAAAGRRRRLGAGLKFSPDGRWLAAGADGYRGDVSVWEVAGDKAPVSLDVGPIELVFLAFSPDSTRIAVASPNIGTFRVCDVKTGARLGDDSGGHEYPPHTLAVRADGTQIYTGSHDTVRNWNAVSGKPLWRYRHGDETTNYVWARVGNVAASPDGKWLASTSYDETVRVVHAEDGKVAFRLRGYKHNPGTVALSADSRRLATCDFVTRQVRVWELETGKALAEHVLRPSGIFFPDVDPKDPPLPDDMGDLLPRGFSFSGDARRLAMSFGEKVYLFDTMTGRELLKFEAPGPLSIGMGFSPDARRLVVGRRSPLVMIKLPNGKDHAVGPSNHLLRLHDAETGKLLHELTIPGHDFGALAYSPDGTLLAANSRLSNTIVVFRAETGEELARFDGGEAHPVSLAISPDNKTLYSGMSDTSVLAWELPPK